LHEESCSSCRVIMPGFSATTKPDSLVSCVWRREGQRGLESSIRVVVGQVIVAKSEEEQRHSNFYDWASFGCRVRHPSSRCRNPNSRLWLFSFGLQKSTSVRMFQAQPFAILPTPIRLRCLVFQLLSRRRVFPTCTHVAD